MNIYLDIETIPTSIPAEKARAYESVHPPGQMTRPETIAKWWAEKAPAAGEEAWQKTALDGGWGEVVAAGVGTDTSIDVFWSDEGDEAAILLWTFGRIEHLCAGQHPTYIGHNVAFDLRFLHHRAIVHGVDLPPRWPYNEEPWRGSYHCTEYEWAGKNGHIKLTELCRILGIESDDEVTGADVYQLWNAGEAGRAQVIEHCRADVERVRAVWARLRPPRMGVREVSSNAG